MANRLTTWNDLDVLTHTALNAEFNNIYAGTVDRTAGRWGSKDDIQVTFGDSQNAILEWDTGQNQDALMMGLSGSNTWIITTKVAASENFALTARSQPAFILHSGDAAALTEYIELRHNETDGLINIGSGALQLQLAGTNKVLLNSAGVTAEDDLAFKSGTDFTGSFQHSITANRIWTFPNKAGTVAMTSDIGSGELGDLEDVTITSAANNNLLAFDSGSNEWINQTAAQAGLAVTGHTHTASQITDFNTAADGRISEAIGVTVQAWDADLDTWATKTAPAGTVVGTTDTQTLTSKTLTSPKLGSSSTWDDAFKEKVVALTDGSTPALNAALGNVFTLVAAGNRTIAAPTNPTNGQKIIIRHSASGANRTLALNTGTGGFRFGSDITELTATTSGKTDYIGCVYHSTDNKWDVVAVTKGF